MRQRLRAINARREAVESKRRESGVQATPLDAARAIAEGASSDDGRAKSADAMPRREAVAEECQHFEDLATE